MSLDVSLRIPGELHKVEARIFVRENGQNKELTREEWDHRFPGQEPIVMVPEESDEVFDYNITGNLYRMAQAASISDYLWSPAECGITRAHQLISPLTVGLVYLLGFPDECKKHNPKNGWGNYEGLVEFVSKYLAACEKYPNAIVHAS